MSLLFLLGSIAQAGGVSVIGEAPPGFAGCLNEAGCAERFYGFLGKSMAEQGFAMSSDSQISSAALHPKEGVFAFATLNTFPFSPPEANLAGKVEQTSYSPVFPHLGAGYATEKSVVSVFFLPPVPVKGAAALVLGAASSSRFYEGAIDLTGEFDLSYVRARAPIVASRDQFNARDSFDVPNNLEPTQWQAVCGDREQGCVDTFTLINPTLRLTASKEVGAFVPYAKLGVTWLHERLWVEYDNTNWGINAPQMSAQLGIGLHLGDKALLALGGSVAYKPSSLSRDGAGIFGKLSGSASWAF